MKRFATICKMEFLLFLRDFFSAFFTLAFPVMMLVIFGSIYGNEPVYSGAELGAMDISVPAYAVMVMGVTGLMAFPLTLAGYKEKKIYKRFDATPVGKGRIILAQVLVNFFMTLAGISLLLLFGKILYHTRILGSVVSICVSLVVCTAAMFSMGFLFTAIGRDAKMTNLLCYLFYFVMLFLSGATIPDMLFSESVENISKLLPMTYAVDFMQGAFAGETLSQHWTELSVLVTLTVLFTAAGAVLYQKKDWS